MGGRSCAAQPAHRHHRQHTPRRILRRQALQPEFDARQAGAARTARIRDATASGHGAGSGTAGSRAGRAVCRGAVFSPAGPLGDCAARAIPATAFALADIAEVVTDLRVHGIEFELSWLLPFVEFRFPRIGVTKISGVELELRSAIEPWHVLGEEAAAGSAARYVDSSTERLQVAVSDFLPERHLLTCNGRPVPLTATGTPGSYVAGVRYKAWKPWSSLHATLGVDTPLAFDLIDRVSRISLGGATYHVVHPGGRSYDHPPVNASEAEARRARRFEAMGHTTGMIDPEALDAQLTNRSAGDDEFPLTLDLRRRVPRAWGFRSSQPRDGT